MLRLKKSPMTRFQKKISEKIFSCRRKIRSNQNEPVLQGKVKYVNYIKNK